MSHIRNAHNKTKNNNLVHIFLIVAIVQLLSNLATVASSDLETDLREFSALIPRRRIGYIGARHYVLDQRFRHALDYVRSSRFQDTWRRLRETREFRNLIDYLTTNTTTIDSTNLLANVPNRLRSFELPNKVPIDMLVQQRNLGNFFKDAVRALPRNRIANLMAKKVQENGDFAKLYQAARADEFRELLTAAKQSRNLAQPLQELARNSINVDEVIEIGFKVLKWGP